MLSLDRCRRAATPSAGVAAMVTSSCDWCTAVLGSSSFSSRLSTRRRDPIATQAVDLVITMWQAAGGMEAESYSKYIRGALGLADGVGTVVSGTGCPRSNVNEPGILRRA